MSKDPLAVLEDVYLADTATVAQALECSVAAAAAAQIEAAEAALPYLEGENEQKALAAISRAEALSKDTATQPSQR